MSVRIRTKKDALAHVTAAVVKWIDSTEPELVTGIDWTYLTPAERVRLQGAMEDVKARMNKLGGHGEA